MHRVVLVSVRIVALMALLMATQVSLSSLSGAQDLSALVSLAAPALTPTVAPSSKPNIPLPPPSHPLPPTSREFREFSRSMPECRPGEQGRPSPFPDVNGCRAIGVAGDSSIRRPRTTDLPRPPVRSILSLLPVPTAEASDLGDLLVGYPRHGCCWRASMGTGQGRDPWWNLPQYGTGGDNYGSYAQIWVPGASVPPTAPGLAMGSLLDFFNSTGYPGGGADEVGWVITSRPPLNCPADGLAHPFTDNFVGGFRCFPYITLAAGSWHSFATIALGGGQWGNYWYNPAWGWTALDIRTGMPDASSGHDHGIEVSLDCCVSGSTTYLYGVQQLRTLGGAWTLVDAVQPAYSFANWSSAPPTVRIELVQAHFNFWAYGP